MDLHRDHDRVSGVAAVHGAIALAISAGGWPRALIPPSKPCLSYYCRIVVGPYSPECLSDFIQRIETEASASLQSKKALASALDLDIHDLDYQEMRMRQEWEDRVVETKDRTALQQELTGFGVEGWELVSATAMFNTLMTKVVYTLFLKRPRVAVQQ